MFYSPEWLLGHSYNSPKWSLECTLYSDCVIFYIVTFNNVMTKVYWLEVWWIRRTIKSKTDLNTNSHVLICKNPTLIFVYIHILLTKYWIQLWYGCRLPFTQGSQDTSLPHHEPGRICGYQMKGLILNMNITCKLNYNTNS